MRTILLLAALAIPACAQFQTAEIRYEGIGCDSCIASLPERLGRIRGIETTAVDTAAGVIRIKFAEQNRVRIEQIRDAIQQDGTKAVSAAVTARGDIQEENGRHVLKLPNVAASYVLRGAKNTGASEITGKIADLRAPAPLAIDVLN